MLQLRVTCLQRLPWWVSTVALSAALACHDHRPNGPPTAAVTETDAGAPNATHPDIDEVGAPDATQDLDATPPEPDVSTTDGGFDEAPDAAPVDPTQVCDAWGDTAARCLLEECPGLQTIASDFAQVTASLCREGEVNEPGHAMRFADVDDALCRGGDANVNSLLDNWRRMSAVKVLCRLRGALNPRQTCEAACDRLLRPCGERFPHAALPSSFEIEARLQALCRIQCAAESHFAEELACLAQMPDETSCEDSVVACLNQRTRRAPDLRVHTNQGLSSDPDGTWLIASLESDPLNPRRGSLDHVRARIFDAQDQLLRETNSRDLGGSAYGYFTTLPARGFTHAFLLADDAPLSAPPATAEVVLVWRDGEGLQEDPPRVLPVEGPDIVAPGHACPREGVFTQCEAPLVCDDQRCLPER